MIPYPTRIRVLVWFFFLKMITDASKEQPTNRIRIVNQGALLSISCKHLLRTFTKYFYIYAFRGSGASGSRSLFAIFMMNLGPVSASIAFKNIQGWQQQATFEKVCVAIYGITRGSLLGEVP
jgi:hypothetical protein